MNCKLDLQTTITDPEVTPLCVYDLLSTRGAILTLTIFLIKQNVPTPFQHQTRWELHSWWLRDYIRYHNCVVSSRVGLGLLLVQFSFNQSRSGFGSKVIWLYWPLFWVVTVCGSSSPISNSCAYGKSWWISVEFYRVEIERWYCRRNHVNRHASRSLPHNSVETDYLTILDWLTPRPPASG